MLVGAAVLARFRFMALVFMGLWTSPASADSFGIPLGSVKLYGTATLLLPALRLPSNDIGGFVLNFVLPQNYKKNTPVRILVYLEGANCTPKVVPFQLVRVRRGRDSRAGLTGLTDLTPSLTLPNNAVAQKVFDLRPGTDPALPHQIAGDSIFLWVERRPDDASDTCDSFTPNFVDVMGIDVRYRTAEP